MFIPSRSVQIAQEQASCRLDVIGVSAFCMFQVSGSCSLHRLHGGRARASLKQMLPGVLAGVWAMLDDMGGRFHVAFGLIIVTFHFRTQSETVMP